MMTIRKFDRCADRLLELIAEQSQISVYQMAAELNVDRTTIYRAIWYLQYQGRIEIAEKGKGRVPNSYKVR